MSCPREHATLVEPSYGLGVVFGAVLLCLLGLLSCRSKTEQQLEELNLSEQEAKRILAEISAKQAPSAPVAPKAPTPQLAPPSAAVELPSSVARFIADELVDVAPAAPSVATQHGVVVINGKNELLLAKLGPLARAATSKPSPITALEDARGPFALGRGPSVAGDYAYWVTSHFLLRRSIRAPHGPVQILTRDARVGTRASAQLLPYRGQPRPWVAYVALPEEKDGPLRAKLWFDSGSTAASAAEQAETLGATVVLTEPANSALSVALSQHDGQLHAFSLEARTGLTALHARPVQVGDPPRPGADQVLWVGGSAQPLSELHLTQSAQGLLGLLPLERDITHFGVLGLSLGEPPWREPSVTWMNYPNGLDPAPVTSARVCDEPVILLVRPSDAQPKAPQELVLLAANQLAPGRAPTGVAQPRGSSAAPTGASASVATEAPLVGQILVRSRAFYDVSIAALQRGALVSYVADHRTWAMTLRCPKS